MKWTNPNERTARSGDYAILQYEKDGPFYLMYQHRNLGRFHNQTDGQRAAVAHAAVVAGAEETFARLVQFLNGDAPQ